MERTFRLQLICDSRRLSSESCRGRTRHFCRAGLASGQGKRGSGMDGQGKRKSSRRSRARIYLQTKAFAQALERRMMLAGAPDAASSPAVEIFNTSPALFVENAGQWEDSSVRFVHQGKGANIALTDSGAQFQLFHDN